MKLALSIALVVTVLYSCTQQSQESSQLSGFDLEQMDTTVNACDNFYLHAIGGWIEDNPVPETEGRWSAFNVLDKANKVKCIAILDALKAQKRSELTGIKMQLRDLYSTAFAETDNSAILDQFKQELEAIDNHDDLMEYFGRQLQHGVQSPLGFYIGQDMKNSAVNVVYAFQSGLSMPDKDYYLEESEKFSGLREKMVETIEQMSELSSFDIDGEAVLKVETKLAEIFWGRVASRDPEKTYNKMDLTDWNNDLNNIDLMGYMRGLGVGQFDSLIVSQNTYFSKLNQLYKDISIEDWKHCARWNTLRAVAPFLSTEMERLNFAFYGTALRGQKEMPALEERTYNTVNDLLGEPLGQLYVEKHFSEESKQYAAEMIENIRSAYRESIEQLSWMSSATKEKALRKLVSFTYKVGYPDKWRSFDSLKTNDSNHLANVLSCRVFNTQFMLNKLKKPVDRGEWGMTPHQVNAYYRRANNEIVFPAGILQPPFFHIANEKAINYGGIGTVIGHEFTHGFDDKGSMFDWDGNLKNWWTDEDRKAFEALAAKIIEQYNLYEPLPGIHVNGAYTIGENIADFGGVSLSYHALKKAYNGTYPEPKEGYSWDQQFFLGYANIWKGSITKEEQLRLLKSDSHSPNEYRVNGPLINFKPFEQSYGVKEHHKMYRADSAKVKIW